ncbi:MAG: acylphosphatase [bacterium]
MKRCIKIIVTGRVQGVFYRDFVRKNAEKLGVEGSVQNQEDGTVIIYACSFAEILDDFIDALYQGSNKSLVEDVSVTPLNMDKNFRGVFRVIG